MKLGKLALQIKQAVLLVLYGVVLAIALVLAAIARVPDATPEDFRRDEKEEWN